MSNSFFVVVHKPQGKNRPKTQSHPSTRTLPVHVIVSSVDGDGARKSGTQDFNSTRQLLLIALCAPTKSQTHLYLDTQIVIFPHLALCNNSTQKRVKLSSTSHREGSPLDLSTPVLYLMLKFRSHNVKRATSPTEKSLFFQSH